jgi:hypothetical protein
VRSWLRAVGCLCLVSPARAAPPEPVPETPPLVVTERQLEVGPDFGVAVRPADDAGQIRYAAGPVWGVHARIEYAPWLGIRPWVRHATHAVSVSRGGLAAPGDVGLEEATFTQRAVSLWILGIQAEPTWVVSPRLRLWSGFGIYWGRLEAEAARGRVDPCASGHGCSIVSARRTGVLLDLTSSLGAIFELVPRWVAVTATLEYGFDISHSGAVFEPVQAFVDGQMHHLRGLPAMRTSMTGLVGIGVNL